MKRSLISARSDGPRQRGRGDIRIDCYHAVHGPDGAEHLDRLTDRRWTGQFTGEGPKD
jgi:hypothetical protein